MKNTYRTTFQVCRDNVAAAKAFTAALVAAGHEAHQDGASVDHECPYDVAHDLIVATEKAN